MRPRACGAGKKKKGWRLYPGFRRGLQIAGADGADEVLVFRNRYLTSAPNTAYFPIFRSPPTHHPCTTMANTYTQIYLQFIFAVRSRESLIGRSVKDEIHRYISGIVRNRHQKLISIGGMPDHVHIFCGIRPPFSLADFVRDVKANSSAYINQQKLTRGRFNWQSGYGAFSYAKSQLDAVAKYVLSQEDHHRRRSFRAEYLDFLRRFEIAFESSCSSGLTSIRRNRRNTDSRRACAHDCPQRRTRSSACQCST
jgi:REP element-mobilizing transposase RayT